jgi:RNA polymerase sigma factor (sigma-70 family)
VSILFSNKITTGHVAGIVESARDGDRRGWEALVQEFGIMIRAIARAHRLGEADAADVAQATWLKLVEHLERIHEPTRVGAWLATTARRECLSVLRDARRSVSYGEDTPAVESRDAAPGDALLTLERDQALWRGFKRLRATDQSLLRLLMSDPRPAYQEISASLDMPIGSIGPTRARALDRLRHELDNEGSLALMST